MKTKDTVSGVVAGVFPKAVAPGIVAASIPTSTLPLLLAASAGEAPNEPRPQASVTAAADFRDLVSIECIILPDSAWGWVSGHLTRVPISQTTGNMNDLHLITVQLTAQAPATRQQIAVGHDRAVAA